MIRKTIAPSLAAIQESSPIPGRVQKIVFKNDTGQQNIVYNVHNYGLTKVQAKLNMFAAYEDELKGREAGVGKLTDLVGQATHLRVLTFTHLLTDSPTSRILLYYLLVSLPFALANVLTLSPGGRRPTRAVRPSVSSRCRRAWPTSATRWRSSRRRVRSTRRGWRSSCSASCASRRCG